MENERHSLSSLPMLARLDHLDFIIKNLEKEENNTKWREENGMRTRGRALDSAVRDAYFKGSLLERVAALENRLFQLCMELESSSTSSTSTGGCGEASTQRTKRDYLPTFTNINPFHQQTPFHVTNATHKSQIQEMAHKVDEGKEKEQKPTEKETGKDTNKTCKSKKKKSPKKWSHFNLLGC